MDNTNSIATDDTDHAEPDAVTLDDRVRPAVAMVRAFVVDVRAQHRKRREVHLLRKIVAAVVELMIADGHRVVTHTDHHFHQRFAAREKRKLAGKNVTGTKKKKSFRALAILLNQRRELRRAAELGFTRQPVSGDRIKGAMKVVGIKNRHLARCARGLSDDWLADRKDC